MPIISAMHSKSGKPFQFEPIQNWSRTPWKHHLSDGGYCLGFPMIVYSACVPSCYQVDLRAVSKQWYAKKQQSNHVESINPFLKETNVTLSLDSDMCWYFSRKMLHFNPLNMDLSEAEEIPWFREWWAGLVRTWGTKNLTVDPDILQ